MKKNSKFGEFFSCEKYSKKSGEGCSYTAKVGSNGEPEEKVVKVLVESTIPCPSCKTNLVLRKSAKGNDYLSCKNWNKDEGCKGIFTMTGEKMDFSKKKNFKRFKKKGDGDAV